MKNKKKIWAYVWLILSIGAFVLTIYDGRVLANPLALLPALYVGYLSIKEIRHQ